MTSLSFRSSIVVAVSATWILALPRLARADPTVSECLDANEAAIAASNRSALRAERAQLVICAAPTCPAEVREECTRLIDEVNRLLPTLVVRAVDTAGTEILAVKVIMDGEVLAERLTGVALPVDPGEHKFVFETQGRASVTKSLVLREAEKERLETVVFEAPRRTQTSESSGLGTQRVLALVAGGIGVVGLGVGSAFGLSAMSQRDEARELCPEEECADDTGFEAWGDARRAGNVSTAAFLVGGAALATGAVLWFTAPTGSSGSLRVGLGHVGWEGTF
jgi:hypothetical protein